MLHNVNSLMTQNIFNLFVFFLFRLEINWHQSVFCLKNVFFLLFKITQLVLALVDGSLIEQLLNFLRLIKLSMLSKFE